MTENEGRRIEESQGGLTAKQEYCLQLYQRHHEEIRRYIARYVRNPHDVDDLMQTVFLNVLVHPGDPENLRAYLYAVARNQVCFYWRRRKRSVLSAQMLSRGAGTHATGSAGCDCDSDPRTQLARQEARTAVATVIGALSGPLRDTLQLRYFEGLRLDAAAARAGCSRIDRHRCANLGFRTHRHPFLGSAISS